MKKWILAFLLLSALGVAAVAAGRYLLPERHVSDLYRRYKHADGIAASYIHNFPVNDTVFVDVTLIEARSDSAWNVLLHDLNITPPPREVIEITSDGCIDIWAAPKKDYSLPMDSFPLNNDLIAISWTERRISVFSIETMQQMHSLKRNQFKESISKSQQ